MNNLSKQLLSDSMSKVDKIYSCAGGSCIYTNEHIQSHCVAHGIILHPLAEICQSENIFASTAISTLLVSPTYMFVDSPQLHRPSQFVTAYMTNKDDTLFFFFFFFFIYFLTKQFIMQGSNAVHRELYKYK
jgi:hypothetical protein